MCEGTGHVGCTQAIAFPQRINCRGNLTSHITEELQLG